MAQLLAQAWSRSHLRLHRHLLRHHGLLPDGASLLLAVSGGQDSMALLGLLLGLQRLHHWELSIWHGDHRWRPGSAGQAEELMAWCREQALSACCEPWIQAVAPPMNEAAARQWRYGALLLQAQALPCSRVVTGHTASDRAETLLLHLARGSHRRGLASLRTRRSLVPNAPEPALVRPLLIFDRSETAQICSTLQLPIWLDPSNGESRFSRNRLRADVLPVLEALHPGAARRISGTAERLALEDEARDEWLDVGLQWLSTAPSGEGHGGPDTGLNRLRLTGLQPVNQIALLEHWIRRLTQQPLTAEQLAGLLDRLRPSQPPGRSDLPAGWRLQWDRSKLELFRPSN